MTKLEAINEMLEWIQQPPATALDTGGTSDEAEAETTIDRINRKVQGEREWYCNTELEIEYDIADVKIAVSGGSGTFTLGETVTESVSAATGTFQYLTGGYIYLTRVSGTFTGTHTLTGGTSAATRTGGAYTAITSSLIPYGTDIIRLWPSRTAGETMKAVQRNGYLWDTDENTDVYTDSITLDIIRLLDFTALPFPLASYVTLAAAWSFLRYKMPGRTEGLQLRLGEVSKARIQAQQDSADGWRLNVHSTHDGRAFLGNRDSSI